MPSLVHLKKAVSCGCVSGTHRRSKSPEFDAWHHMIQRCYNPNNRGYKNYGGRGIAVDESWRNSFVAFYRDLGPRPSNLYSIDRIDNNGNYAPGNCRWATEHDQKRNRRDNRHLTVGGETLIIADWAARSGISVGTILARLKRGWSDAEAVTHPILPRGVQYGVKVSITSV